MNTAEKAQIPKSAAIIVSRKMYQSKILIRNKNPAYQKNFC